MKFGQRLRTELVLLTPPAYEEHYIDYKQLKKKINQIARHEAHEIELNLGFSDGAEEVYGEFCAGVELELKRAGDFFDAQRTQVGPLQLPARPAPR